MPRADAARDMFPCASARAAVIVSFSTVVKASFKRVTVGRGLAVAGVCSKEAGRSDGKISEVFANEIARSMMFSNSRTLPG